MKLLLIGLVMLAVTMIETTAIPFSLFVIFTCGSLLVVLQGAKLLLQQGANS